MAAARVAVLGAGSVGCFIGGAWAAAGIPVTLIGRQAIGEEIAREGLRLSDSEGWSAELAPGRVDFRTSPEALAGAETILLTVKSGATAAAAEQIARHAREGATVISFQNGIGNVDVLEQRLGACFEVVRGVVPFNVAHLGGGRFHKGVAGRLFAGRTPVTEALSAEAGNGPAALEVRDDMLALAWGKLLINLNNAVNALSGRTLLEELRERDYRRVLAACMSEGLALLGRAGIEPAKLGPAPPRLLPAIIASPDWLFNSVFVRSWKIDAKARSSMADDLAAGRTTEVDVLNGELVRLAERLHADAPINRRVVALVRAAEQGAAPLSAPNLRRAVLGSG